MNWNKGNSTMMHRIDTIRHIINEHKPDIFAIQEANLKSTDDIRLAQIQGYFLETDQLIKSKNLARTVMYISHQIRYKRLEELESKIEPVIWIEIQKNGGNKKIRIQNYYRQWQEMDLNGAIPETKSVKEQTQRFLKVIKIWSNQILLDQNEIISMSDTNINLNLNYSAPETLEYHDRKMIPLYRILNTQIFNLGASNIKTAPTKINHHKEYSYIDHLITNHPNKIIQPRVIKSGWSDHLITTFTRLTKNQILIPKYRIIRKFNDINWSQVKAEIQHDSRMKTILQSTDSQEIAENLIQTIEDNISSQAPLKRIQNDNKYPKFISNQTRETIKQRDQALLRTRQPNSTMDDTRQYKTLRNRTHKMISQDKKN